jgi:hypothetical protein
MNTLLLILGAVVGLWLIMFVSASVVVEMKKRAWLRKYPHADKRTTRAMYDEWVHAVTNALYVPTIVCVVITLACMTIFVVKFIWSVV